MTGIERFRRQIFRPHPRISVEGVEGGVAIEHNGYFRHCRGEGEIPFAFEFPTMKAVLLTKGRNPWIFLGNRD